METRRRRIHINLRTVVIPQKGDGATGIGKDKKETSAL